MSFLSTRGVLGTIFGRSGGSATAATVAAAAAAATTAARAVLPGAGGGGVWTTAASATAAAAEAERQVNEVVHVLSPGPLAQRVSEMSRPPSTEELRVAAAEVKSAKEAWRRLSRGE